MNLHKRMSAANSKALGIKEKDILYCVPFDLDRNDRYADGTLIVTKDRLMTAVNGEKLLDFELCDAHCLRYEAMIGCGIVVADIDGQACMVARASLKHSERCAELVSAVNRMLAGWEEDSRSRSKEKYCDNCGSVLIGGVCPKCNKLHVRFARFTDLCKPYIGKLLLISAIMLINTFSRLYSQEINKDLINDFLIPEKGSIYDVLPLFLMMVILMVVSVISTIVKKSLTVRLGSSMSMYLRGKVFSKLQSLSMSYIARRPMGEIMQRITFDTNAVRDFMERCFGNMCSNLMTMIGAIIYMSLINWKLTLVVVVFVPVALVLFRLFNRRIHRMFHAQARKGDSIKSRLQDVISGIRVVKTFGCERREADNFDELSDELARINSRNEVFWAIFFPLVTFVIGLGADFVILFGGLDVLNGVMQPGTLVQFSAYAAMIYAPLRWMANIPRMIMRMVNSLDRMYEILDEEPDITDREKTVKHEITGNVKFESVTFGYDPGTPVLSDISFEVKRGEMIGLVGASGVGKSTLINLLMRLYDPDHGRITVDGIDLRDYDSADYHRQIGVVLQETFMFSGTIAANIRYARPDATMDEVIAAAKMANAHDYICCLPDGYDTYITERGNNVSGGERQRIAIARAILADPRLLILDEATSALDTESEELVQQAIERLTEGRTTFAIAHRLSTLRHADRIIVFDKHKIAEVGTHTELVDRHGIYYGLVTAQSRLHRVKDVDEY